MGLQKLIPARTRTMVLSIANKLQKKHGARASDIENNVSSAILDIQNGADNATKEQLMQLHLVAVKEMDVGGRSHGPSTASRQLAEDPDQDCARAREEVLRQARHDHRPAKGDGAGGSQGRRKVLQAKAPDEPKRQGRARGHP